MKVLLCWPYIKQQNILDDNNNQIAIDGTQRWHGLPLGIGYIGSYLDSLGIEVKCYDFSFHTFDDVQKVLADEMPDILGITCHTAQRGAVWDMFKFMKSIKPKCVTVMGGYHASLMWEQTLNNFNSFIDYCVYGDGSITMRDLAAGKDKTAIPNLAYMLNGKPHLNPLEYLPLDESPFLKYELFNWDDPKLSSYYTNGEQRLNNFNFHILTMSRGCYGHCAFCCITDVWKKYSYKSPARIAAEIDYMIKQYGKPSQWFKFVDETFPVKSSRLIDTCKAVEKLGIRWEACFRGDIIDNEVMGLLGRSGLFNIPVGMESGSQKILDGLDKGITVEGLYDTFQYAHYNNINTYASLIVGSVGETDETIEETKNVIRDLCPGNLCISYYTIFPGTKLYTHAKNLGIIDDDYWITEKPPPIYTYENSPQKLKTWQDDIYNTWFNDVFLPRGSVYLGQASKLLDRYIVKLNNRVPVNKNVTQHTNIILKPRYTNESLIDGLDARILQIDGWMRLDELSFLYDYVKQMPQGSVVVEIGTWLGRSTSALLAGCNDKIVITIDNWRGQAAFRDNTQSLASTRNLLDMFINNIRVFDIEPIEFISLERCEPGNLYYISGDSGVVFDQFPDKSIDFWFHDGDHLTVGRDYLLWKSKHKDDCKLLGHDYSSGFPEVIEDVNKYIKSINHDIGIVNAIWYKK